MPDIDWLRRRKKRNIGRKSGYWQSKKIKDPGGIVIV